MIVQHIANLSNYNAAERRQAAEALTSLSESAANCAEIQRAQGIPLLVRLFRVSSNTLPIVANLSTYGGSACLRELVEAGALPHLVAFSHHRDAQIRRNAALTLENISASWSCQSALRGSGVIRALLHLLRSRDAEERGHAQRAISNFLHHEENHAAFRAADGFHALVACLNNNYDHDLKFKVALSLCTLSRHEANCHGIRRSGGIDSLARLLSSLYYYRDDGVPINSFVRCLVWLDPYGRDTIKKVITETLSNLSRHEENRLAIHRSDGIAPLVGLLEDGSTTIVLHSVGTVANLSGERRYHGAIRRADGVQPLVNLIKDERVTESRRLSAVALTGLADNTNNHVVIREAGGVQASVDLLKENSVAVAKYASHLVANLSFNRINSRLIGQEVNLERWSFLLDVNNVEVRRNTAQILANVSRYHAQRHRPMLEDSAIRSLVDLLINQDVGAQKNAVFVLASLSHNVRARTAMRGNDGVARLAGLLDQEDAQIRRNALKILVDFSLDTANPVIISDDDAQRLASLLNHEDMQIKKGALKALSNFSSHVSNQVDIEESGVRCLMHLLNHEDDEIKLDALKALANFSSHPNNQINIEDARIRSLTALLSHACTEIKINALKALVNLSCRQRNKIDIRNVKIVNFLDENARIDMNGIHLLVRLLHGNDFDTSKMALQALANFSCHADNQIELGADYIPQWVGLLSLDDIQIKRDMAKALANFSCQAGNQVEISRARICHLVRLLNHEDRELKKDALKALKNFSYHSRNQVAIGSM